MRAPLLATLLAALPVAGLACTPVFHDIEGPVTERGDLCEVRVLHDGFQVTGLYAAQNLGAGQVLQPLLDGNGCYRTEIMIVSDCRSGEALAFGGPGGWDDATQWEAAAAVLEAVRAAAGSGAPLPMAEVAARATAAGLDEVVPMRATATIEQSGHRFTLGCGCQTFYPDLPGARP